MESHHCVNMVHTVPRTETGSHTCASLRQYLPLSEPLQLKAKGKKKQQLAELQPVVPSA